MYQLHLTPFVKLVIGVATALMILGTSVKAQTSHAKTPPINVLIDG